MKVFIIFLTLLFSQSKNAQCFQEIAVGFKHNLIIRTDGTLWSWGSNQSGELGINSGSENVWSPQLVNSSTNWQSIFAGSRTSFAIKNDGTLWVWGDGTGGRLGLGNQNSVYIPTQLGSDTDWEYITSGSHTIAKKTDGSLWGWGSNIYGQLNLNTNSIELNPVQISSDTSWLVVVAGGLHTLAMKNDGTLWACGLNNEGQLGDGTTINKLQFVQIGNDNDWVQIDAGEKYSIGLKSDGTIWGWGQNHQPWTTSYIFGDNYPDQILTPTLLSFDNDWDKISCDGFLLGKKINGTIWNIGNNTQIGNDADWLNLYVGNSHFFSTKIDFSLWGYGNNSSGELGLVSEIQFVTVTTQLECSTLGQTEISNLNKWMVYPNPTSDKLFIKSSSSNPINEVMITDLTGKTLFKTENATQIDFSNYQNGIYIISIYSSNRNSKFRVIKK